MPIVKKSALVPFAPAQIFALVDNVEAYPEFLPWCKSTQVIARTADELTATIEISKSGVGKSFTTSNRNQQDKMIEMRLVEGPFKRLQGFWRFDPLGDAGCKVSLDLEFEFSNRVLEMVVGPVFNQIANSLVDSFLKRAADVYGEN
jgi:ribosome-associated toxin RatA of RatAB toxin-antitoxin module